MSWPSFWVGFFAGAYTATALIAIAFFYDAHVKYVERQRAEAGE